MNMIKRTYIYLLFLLIVAGCVPSRDISNKNMVSMYRTDDQLFHPEIAAFILSDSSARLFVKIKLDELLFVRQPDNAFRASMRVHCELISSYDDTRLLDSASADFDFSMADRAEAKILYMDFPLHTRIEQILHVQLIDMRKGFHEDYFIPIDHRSQDSRNRFLFEDRTGPLFRNYASSADSISISYSGAPVEKVWCKYYKREFPLPPPPFGFNVHEEFNYKPDSIFSVIVNTGDYLQFQAEGFYHFQKDTTSKDGATLFRFTKNYPNIISANQMVDPVRYLTSRKEFEELKKKESPKAAIDEFWLVRGNRNEEKTRTLIKKYYGRVQEANKLFSSYVEGWRTDRGMIYVIFGSPTTVYKNANSETWIYGTANSPLAVNFFFMKVENPFTTNDYLLSRAPVYESSWYRAVEIWRQGRPYNSFY